MRSRKALLASGFAIVLVAGGGTAFGAVASSGPMRAVGIWGRSIIGPAWPTVNRKTGRRSRAWSNDFLASV